MTGLDDRRAEAAGRLDALWRERSAALLDGKPFADEEITAAEQDLDTLAEAEAEAVRREKEAALIEERRGRLRIELLDREAERQAAVMRAERRAARRSKSWSRGRSSRRSRQNLLWSVFLCRHVGSRGNISPVPSTSTGPTIT
jgi:hypothetical protein